MTQQTTSGVDMNTREQSAAIKKTVVENATRELVLVHTGKFVELFVYAIRYRTKIHLHERLGVRFEFLVSDKEAKSLRCKDFSYVFLSRFSQFCAKKIWRFVAGVFQV